MGSTTLIVTVAVYILLPHSEGVHCGWNLTNETGILFFPGNGLEYDDNLDCQWTILAETHSKIHLSFTFLDIENTQNCQHDYMQIQDGVCEEGIKQKRHCGQAIPLDFTSTANYLCIKFVSGRFGSGKGFILKYHHVNGNLTSPDLEVKSTRVKWAQAAKKCLRNGGHLAIPNNTRELQYIQHSIQEDDKVWTGRYLELSPWASAMSCYNGSKLSSKPLSSNGVAACFSQCQTNDVLLQVNNCFCVQEAMTTTVLSNSLKVNYSLCDNFCAGPGDDVCGGQNTYLHYKRDNKIDIRIRIKNEEGISKCAYITIDDGMADVTTTLTSDSCSSDHGVLCKTMSLNGKEDTVFCPPYGETLSWIDAVQTCQDFGAIPADLDSIQSKIDVVNELEYGTYWIYLKRSVISKQLKGDPDAIKPGNKRCCYVDKYSDFNDKFIGCEDCNSTFHYFVCRNDSSSETINQNPSTDVPDVPTDTTQQVSTEKIQSSLEGMIAIVSGVTVVVLASVVLTAVCIIRKKKRSTRKTENLDDMKLCESQSISTAAQGTSQLLQNTRGEPKNGSDDVPSTRQFYDLATAIPADNTYNVLNTGQNRGKTYRKSIDDQYDHTLNLPDNDTYHRLGAGKLGGVPTNVDSEYDIASATPTGDDEYHRLDIRNPKSHREVEGVYDHTGNMDAAYDSLRMNGRDPTKQDTKTREDDNYSRV